MINKPTFSLNSIISQLDSQFHWPTKNITYSFANIAPSSIPASSFSALNQNQKSAAEKALDLWSDIANINFTQGSNNSADIVFANDINAGIAYAYYPQHGDIFINPNAPSNSELNFSQFGFTTILHELGHALGLNHPGDYNAGDSNNLSYQNHAEYRQDSRQYTLMSYWDAENTGAVHHSSYASTPLLHDIAAIQAIYGANTSTRSGDTVYGFNSNADREVYHFDNYNAAPVLTIWDGAGNDTLDFSKYWQNATINLTQGSFSDVAGLTKNIAIAFSTDIENAIGGSGNDSLIGQHLDNTLNGGNGNDFLQGYAGNDQLIGGAGTDTAIFSGNTSQYSILALGAGNYQISGADGVDNLFGIEQLKFDDTAAMTLNQSLSQLAKSDQDNTPTQANTISAGSTIKTSIGGADQSDYFKFTALIDGFLAISLNTNDHSIALYDNQLNILKPQTYHAIQHSVIKGNTYYIKAISTQNNQLDYQLNVQFNTDENQDNALLLSIGLFQAAPGALFLNNFDDQLDKGISLQSLASTLVETSEFKSLYSENLSNSELSHNFINNLMKDEASDHSKSWAANWMNNQLEIGKSLSETSLTVINTLQNLNPTDIHWGNAKKAWDNKMAVAKWYSLDKNLSNNNLESLQSVIATVTSDPQSVTNITSVTDANQSIELIGVDQNIHPAITFTG